jgi:hypothetical protein
MSGPSRDLLDDLLRPLSRERIVSDVRAALGVEHTVADQVVEAFDVFVAQPLAANLRAFRGRDVAKRNPLIYTLRGVSTVTDWVTRVLADRETSAIEGHLGTFLEELARILSAGIKPGNGVDLQIADSDGVVHLFAIQTATNTKNSGSRKSDIAALKTAARPLRAARRHVELHIAVLHGRRSTGVLRAEPDITIVGSDDFWEQVSGIVDFRSRLLPASVALSPLIRERASDQVGRIQAEARDLFGGESDLMDLGAIFGSTVVPTREE